MLPHFRLPPVEVGARGDFPPGEDCGAGLAVVGIGASLEVWLRVLLPGLKNAGELLSCLGRCDLGVVCVSESLYVSHSNRSYLIWFWPG